MSGEETIRTVAVIGVGGVGGYFGGRIAHRLAQKPSGKTTIAFVARGRHLEAIRREGLLLRMGEGPAVRCRPNLATDRIAELPAPDLCLLCVKGYDLPGVLAELAPSVAADTVIVPVLNGVDIYERIRQHLSTGIVLPACVYVSANIEKPGTVVQRGMEGLILSGPDPQHPQEGASGARAFLDSMGIAFRWNADPFPAIWEKYLFIASFGLVTAWAGKSFGEVLASRELSGLVRSITAEILALAAKRAVRLPPETLEATMDKAAGFPAETRTSYQRDVEAGRQGEGDLFGATILRLGESLGVPVPVTRRIHGQIEARLAAGGPEGRLS